MYKDIDKIYGDFGHWHLRHVANIFLTNIRREKFQFYMLNFNGISSWFHLNLISFDIRLNPNIFAA